MKFRLVFMIAVWVTPASLSGAGVTETAIMACGLGSCPAAVPRRQPPGRDFTSAPAGNGQKSWSLGVVAGGGRCQLALRAKGADEWVTWEFPAPATTKDQRSRAWHEVGKRSGAAVFDTADR